MDQFNHIRQHLNYRAFKCGINSKCGQRFCTRSSFVEHLKSYHKMSDQSINSFGSQPYSYEGIAEIEELLNKSTTTATTPKQLSSKGMALPLL